MNFLELVQNRYSVRRYKDQPVEGDKLMRCLEAARLAPSASNSQPWRFIVVDDSDLKNRIARASYNQAVPFNKFVLQAPVIVVFVLERSKLIARIGGRIKNREYRLIDIGIAAEHFCLQAEAEGLGTCMIGWFDEKTIKKLLNIPDEKSIGLLVSLGYPAHENRTPKNRKAYTDLVRYNSY